MSTNELNRIIYGYSTTQNNLEYENRSLKETVKKLQEESKKFSEMPLMVCEVKEMLKDKVIIKIPNGNQFLVNTKVQGLRAGDTVVVEQKNLTIIKKLSRATKRFDVEKFVIIEKPTITWNDIGGLKEQIQEIQEVIELPLKKPELFKKVGIKPPKGILLYGDPGTGKTLLAKAVANSTNSTFIEIVASELVQKFIGEGAKLVKEIFELAREKAPSIVFIDELDALAAKRIEIGTSGEREVQRTFMQFLAELDGFKPLDNVKIIGCTNRKDILDLAILRPGRLDRLILVGLPDKEGREQIFKIHSKEMTLENVNLHDLVRKTEEFSGAEIRAVCTEAGYFAIRDNRTRVNKDDFEKAVVKVKRAEEQEGTDYLNMFG